MGVSTDYPNVPDWVSKSEGYQTGAMVKYKGNIFYANFWASEPGVGDAKNNGWRFYDELYDQTPHTATEQAKIIAYIPTWRKKEEFNYANEEMYQYITHGIVAFLMFSETNLGEFDPTSVNDVNAVLSNIVNTGHEKGTRISIALGGAVDYGFLNLMTSVGNNSANPLLDKAVQNVVNFVNSNDLDGVDLDLECWWDKNNDPSKDQGGRDKNKGQGPHPAGYGLTLFAQKLKQAMPDKLVSATLFGTSWYGNNYDPKIADYVDWLAIMTYDLTGSWNESPVGPHSTVFKIRNQDSAKIRNQEFYQESYIQEQQGEWPAGRGTTGDPILSNPILSVEDTLWYWTNSLFVNWQGSGQNIPRNKIAAGVPIYGYDFAYGKDPDDLSGQIAPGYKTIQYKDILSQFPDAHTAANGNIKVPGNTPRPPFISAAGTYPYAHNIYFETPKTAADKLNFLKSVGVQGVIIWELSNDVWEEGKSIIKTLYKNSGNPATRPALPSKIKPEPDSTPIFQQEWIGVFPDEWSESAQISRALQNLSTKDAQLSISLQNSATRGPDEQLPIGISGSPAVAVFDGKLYCVHEGQKFDGWLWVCTFDGKNWSEDTKLPNHGTTGPPALAEYNGKLYCIHQGQKVDGWLWVCTFDGKNWSEDTKLPFGTGAKIEKKSTKRRGLPPVALAVYQGLLYCVHEGQGAPNPSDLGSQGVGRQGDGWLWVCTFDGQNWSEDKKLPDHGTSSAPALAAAGNHLLCLHEGFKEQGWLWYTTFNGKTWSKDTQLTVSGGGGYGTSGPPVLIANGNQFFAVHEGREDDGWLWSFNNTENVDRKLTAGGPEPYIGTTGAPGLALYNDVFYLLHQGRGVSGWLWMTTTAALPSSSSNWIELHGDNSYCYCACNSATNNKQGHASNHTMNIRAGAPYFYAVLTKDDDTVDFPTGAVLTIEGPDGTKYDRDIQDENQLVIMSGSSVRCLIVKDPKPGDWKMTMTVTGGIGFHCECNTVPSKDPYTTITTALRTTNQLQKREISKKGWVGSAMVVNITSLARIGFLAGGPLGGLVGGIIGGALNAIILGNIAHNANLPIVNNAQYLRDIAANYSQQPITVNVMRIATWNVYHGDFTQPGVDPYGNQRPASTITDRVDELVTYGNQNNIDIIAFQEMQQAILNNPNHQIFNTIANTNYLSVIVNREYPLAGPAPASATADGYLIVYNPTVLNLQPVNAAGNQWEFFQPQNFLQGIAQARPPVRLRFQIVGTQTTFNFLTWHAEPQQAFAAGYVQTAYNILNQQGGNWIIAGDLNIRENALPQGLVDPHHLTHDHLILDHILTSGTVVDPGQQMINGPNGVPVNGIVVNNVQWGRFWSDRHYVLFGIMWF
ncbi:hypothetical protein FACHB389_19505 [Nostoc calcicola FACHB-389]|nr:endonuclease/exonuclease/phosphatase family protein [Nostoc calcicola FACHB-3891]OKH32602.1 hypothetical protein FACHB389_19505 [Nostoc calcicola FACHB-389]